MENIKTKQAKKSESLVEIINKFKKSLGEAYEQGEGSIKDFKGSLIFGYIEDLQAPTSTLTISICGKQSGAFAITDEIIKRLYESANALTRLKARKKYGKLNTIDSLLEELLKDDD